MTKLTLMDLFSGCGGMTTGFTQQDFETVLAVEWDRPAAATYAANHGEEHVIAGDISEVSNASIPAVDVMIGGPPCQGFSNLGRKKADDQRNQLWRQYIRFVRSARPKVFVIENVDRFHKSEEFALLGAEVQDGQLKGYALRSAVVNAADYGVPQRRRRTVIIGSRVGPVDIPAPTHSEYPTVDENHLPWVTVRDAIEGLPGLTQTTELPGSHTEFFGQAMPGVFKGLDIHFGRNPTALSQKRYSFIPPGGGRLNLPDTDELRPPCWRGRSSGTTDVMGRMRWDRPSLTIRTEFFKPEKGAYLHPQWEPGHLDQGFLRGDPDESVDRAITHYEASLLQGFPADYLWVGNKTSIARQIGNAVPPPLARSIALTISSALC